MGWQRVFRSAVPPVGLSKTLGPGFPSGTPPLTIPIVIHVGTRTDFARATAQNGFSAEPTGQDFPAVSP
jgi:hypothetical protein